jgi:Flp pilus assembly pilin Flp
MTHLHRDETGATAVEYAFMASLIAAVIAATIVIFGQEVLGLFQLIVDLWP